MRAEFVHRGDVNQEARRAPWFGGSSIDSLAEQVLPPLRRALRGMFRRAPHDFIVDSAADAFLEYITKPSRFDPSRGISLERFLLHAAARNLQDRLRADARGQVREQSYAEHLLLVGHCCSQPDAVAVALESVHAILPSICSGDEREAVLQWLNGEGTDRLALALGLKDLSRAEQRKEVKRFKDRMTKRLRRYGKDEVAHGHVAAR